jgi:hypothetical protein
VEVHAPGRERASVCKPLGDLSLTVEFGDELSLLLNVRVITLHAALRAHPVAGVTEAIPTNRSLDIVDDPRVVSREGPIACRRELGAGMGEIDELASRHVTIPVWHDDPWSQEGAMAHGALYATRGEREEYATALFDAMRTIDPALVAIVVGPAVRPAAAETGVLAVRAGYVDLADRPNGFPVIERTKRSRDPDTVAERAVRIVRTQRLDAADGSQVSVAVPTIGEHGDALDAVGVAAVLRERLAAADIEVVPLARML